MGTGCWFHLLRLFPAMPEAGKIRSALNANLEAKNIAGEAAYLKEANRASFERTYAGLAAKARRGITRLE